jgi:pyrroline-5-carboxylate reductase
MSLRGVRIAVIGAGTMGQALIRGLLAHGVPPSRLRASEARATARRAVSRRFGIAALARNTEAARGADVVLLAVKPQQMAEVVGQLAPVLTRRQLVVSIAAGITLRWLEARLPGAPLVRVMPNLPATVGCGFSALAPGRRATARHRAVAKALFAAVGTVVELPERHFDAVTAVSGSGPAYVFYLVDVWEAAARALGLPPALAARGIRQTLEGGVRLLQADSASAAELIKRVASKRGTTEAALKVLARRRVGASFSEALRAAARRSRELSRRP